MDETNKPYDYRDYDRERNGEDKNVKCVVEKLFCGATSFIIKKVTDWIQLNNLAQV